MQDAKASFPLRLGVLVKCRTQDVFASHQNDLDIPPELGKRNKRPTNLTCGCEIPSHCIHNYAQWTR